MEKSYLVVVRLDNVHYIQLAKHDNGQYMLSAHENKAGALKQFDGFRTKAMGPGYENHISGSIGIINLQPHIIEVPKHDPESLRQYVIEDTAYKLHGGMFGAFVDMHGLKVKEEILELSVCDVANEYINEVYAN